MMQTITAQMVLAQKLPRYVDEAYEADEGEIALRIGVDWITLTAPQVAIISELWPLQVNLQSGTSGWTLRHGVGASKRSLPIDAIARPGEAREDLLFILIGRAVRRFKGACALADFHSRLADLFHMADAALA
ncbi:hypothetical protein [Rhizobium sp. FKL33]|uniref:hypothetical protein n=1 Tax=Rhizobium sp. FKL33 TaxID=2562307 RepID=UPI0010BFE50C|nr:hypothetical protein [Rhizobium sp. FKL33]